MREFEEIRPSKFTNHPWSSVLRNSETETIAFNIMKILARTGDKFRSIGWDEYKSERLKDGRFTENEKRYFELAMPYCVSAEDAVMFSPYWADQL